MLVPRHSGQEGVSNGIQYRHTAQVMMCLSNVTQGLSCGLSISMSLPLRRYYLG